MMQSALSVESAALDIAAAGLSTSGYAVLSIAIDHELLLVLRTEGFSHRDALLPAATGRGDGKHTSRQRGDSTLWLDDAACGDASRRFLAGLEDLRRQLTGRLMLGINEVEAHYALYPPGAGYARHRDRFRDDDARVLSLVCYLNNDWLAESGGALRLHLPDGAIDILPCIGTMVIFLSAEIEHEVLAATRERLSIAAWFRRRDDA